MIQKEYDFLEISDNLATLETNRRRMAIYNVLETKNTMLASLARLEEEAQCYFNEFLMATELLPAESMKEAVAQGKDAYKKHLDFFQKVLKSSILKLIRKMDSLEDTELFQEKPYQDVILQADFMLTEVQKANDVLKESLQHSLSKVNPYLFKVVEVAKEFIGNMDQLQIGEKILRRGEASVCFKLVSKKDSGTSSLTGCDESCRYHELQIIGAVTKAPVGVVAVFTDGKAEYQQYKEYYNLWKPKQEYNVFDSQFINANDFLEYLAQTLAGLVSHLKVKVKKDDISNSWTLTLRKTR